MAPATTLISIPVANSAEWDKRTGFYERAGYLGSVARCGATICGFSYFQFGLWREVAAAIPRIDSQPGGPEHLWMGYEIEGIHVHRYGI